MTAPRYAIYHAPAVDSPWWRFGAGWLGWDDRRGAPLEQPRLPEFSPEEFHALTTEPRRYGFHATLKAPFRLRESVPEGLLLSRVDALASRLRRTQIGPLLPILIEDFVALVPAQRAPGVDSLASLCVMDLDDLRAPLSPQELARRRPERLNPRARAMLERFGYPHVLELFRFHMTLSGPVDTLTADLLVHRAEESVRLLNAEPMELDRLCVFREDHPGAPFLRVHERVLAP